MLWSLRCNSSRVGHGACVSVYLQPEASIDDEGAKGYERGHHDPCGPPEGATATGKARQHE